MRLAFISDIHTNSQALLALSDVLAEADPVIDLAIRNGAGPRVTKHLLASGEARCAEVSQ
jgi:hypothetical protein